MIRKTKICSGCGLPKVIWKTVGRDRYCVICWNKSHPPVVKSPKKTKPKSISSKQVIKNKEYTQVRQSFLYKHEFCQARLPGCTMWATEVHHKAGRIGDLLTDPTNFLAVCRSCHQNIELHHELAVDLGYSINRTETNDQTNRIE